MREQPAAPKPQPHRATLEDTPTLPQPIISAWQAVNWIANRRISSALPSTEPDDMDFPQGWDGYVDAERELFSALAKGTLIARGRTSDGAGPFQIGYGPLLEIPLLVFEDMEAGIWPLGALCGRRKKWLWETVIDGALIHKTRPSPYQGPTFADVQFTTNDVLQLWPAKHPAKNAFAEASVPSSQHVPPPPPPRPARPRGRQPELRNETIAKIRADLAHSKFTLEELDKFSGPHLVHNYGVHRQTAEKARDIVVAEGTAANYSSSCQ